MGFGVLPIELQNTKEHMAYTDWQNGMESPKLYKKYIHYAEWFATIA
jgi:hypothetical protein